MTNCEDDDEASTLSYIKMHHISVKFILTYNNHVKSLEDKNERIVDKLNQLKKTYHEF